MLIFNKQKRKYKLLLSIQVICKMFIKLLKNRILVKNVKY